MMSKNTVIIVVFCVLLTWFPWSNAKTINDYLAKGELDAGIADFSAQLNQGDVNNEIVFSLATLHFFSAIEQLAQSFYEVGLNSNQGRMMGIPFLRLPVAHNPNPKVATANDIHLILKKFYTDIEQTNQVLQRLEDKDFIVSIDIGRIRLDLDGNQKLDPEEYFHHIYLAYNREASDLFKDDNPVTVHFDHADAYWLKGYTHLLMALADAFLAHDASEVFNYAGHLFFAQVDTPISKVLAQQKHRHYDLWTDMIAAIHVMTLPVHEPARMQSAHAHLLEVIATSRQSWALLNQETDDDKEWIPNVKQTSVTGVQFNEEMITGWETFLKEAEDILMGKKLIAHWRISDGRGVNIQKVFLEPRPFDPILWVQGSAAIPYLEKGTLSTPETWMRLNRLFQGNFIGFALWIN